MFYMNKANNKVRNNLNC